MGGNELYYFYIKITQIIKQVLILASVFSYLQQISQLIN